MASANTVSVRKPKVTIAGGAVDRIFYKAALPITSGAPTLGYSYHSNAGGDKVQNPTAEELIKKIAEAQNLMFEPPEIKDIVIYDGSGNATIFTGYDTGPHHEIMFNGLSNGKNLVHRCSRLSFINTTIYRPPPPAKGQTQPPVATSPEILKSAKNPCEALKLVLEKIIKDFLMTTGSYSENKDFIIRKKIHEDNLKILNEEWYPILNASTESAIPAFSSAMADLSIRVSMYDYIASVYLSGASDFSTVISQFESLFQMLFVPGNRGVLPGKFIPMTAVLSGEEDKEVNIISLAMNPGPKEFLVPTSVAVRGAPPVGRPPVATAPSARAYGSDVVSWPDPIPASGQTVLVQLPAWLPSRTFPDSITKTGNNLDFEANFKKIKEQQEQMIIGATLIQKICSDVARLVYNDISLVRSTAALTCPLDVSWELGKRYSVKQPNKTSGGSSVLFSGFLKQIQHRLSSSPAAPEAITVLTFSHVEANGFTLPNK